MKILHSYEEALKIATPYIKDKNLRFETPPNTSLHVPEHVYDPIWKMDMDALQNTISYIFRVGLPCYMVCINESNQCIFYKLENTETPKLLKKTFIKEENKVLQNKNRYVSASQKNIALNALSNPARIMQCIVKPFSDLNKKTTTAAKEYENLMEQVLKEFYKKRRTYKVRGVYIFNLSDTMLLRKDGYEPFQNVLQRVIVPFPSSFLPIFSTSGHVDYRDIPIPNYDDIIYVNPDAIENNSNLKNLTTDWEEKTIKKAVFRGGPSGCGFTNDTNMRLKLNYLAKTDPRISELVDCEIVGKGEKTIRFDPIHGFGFVTPGYIEEGPRKSMSEQSKFKMIIHIDGNVNAYRLLTTMYTGSLIVRVKSPYVSWFDHLIEKDVHYVEVNEDLSNLESVIKACLMDDAKSKKIAMNGMKFAKEMMTSSNIHSPIIESLVNIFLETTRYNFSTSPKVPPPPPLPKQTRFEPTSPEGPPPGYVSPKQTRFEPTSPEGPPPGYVSPKQTRFEPTSPAGPPPGYVSPKRFEPTSPAGPPPGYVSPKSNKPKSLEKSQKNTFENWEPMTNAYNSPVQDDLLYYNSPSNDSKSSYGSMPELEPIPPSPIFEISSSPTSSVSSNGKGKRCPKGTRKNKKTGVCENKVSSPKAPSPKVASPKVASLKVASLKVPSPKVPSPKVASPPKSKRCPKGTRKNKKTGVCEPIQEKDAKSDISSSPKSTTPRDSDMESSPKSKRCSKGTRKNKKTGICEPIHT